MLDDVLLILALAEKRGLIDPEPGSAEAPSSRLERLVREGKLGQDKVTELRREVAGGIGDAPTTQAPREEIVAVRDLAGERYQILELLGSGGMGRVYRARDRRLERDVAFKVLLGEGEPARALREASAQARVEHPHICKVYEVGVEAAGPFISMQLVHGASLASTARDMSVEQRVRVAVSVAYAVHEAHKQGLIHRDLKPGNILVEHRDETGWHPYVTDFGLAFDQERHSLVTGNVAGTPHFMAPEQARGSSAIDRRTDVYGLGATFFNVFSGELPFTGSTAEVLVKVLEASPRRLRAAAPSLPRDLGTIVDRCMEKEPARRYDSARALAEDLERFLDGRPIVARPPSLFYRARKLLGRHRALAALGATALVLAALLVRTGAQGAARAEAAERFGREVAGIEQIMRDAHTMPLHDVRREQAIVRRRLAAIAGETDQRGPADAALGRGALALGELEGARLHLERAWKRGNRDAATAAALGQTLGAMAEERLERAGRIEDRSTREAEVARIRQTLQAPALRYLAEVRDGQLLPQALAALLEGQTTQVVALAGRARAASPWLYEAQRLAGDAWMDEARRAELGGDEAGALARLATAGREYAAALELGRSDPELHRAECKRLIATARIEQAHGRSLLASGGQAIAACDRAIEADPGRVQPYLDEIYALVRVVDYQNLHWNESTPQQVVALARAAQALALAPAGADAYVARASVHNVRAEWLAQTGKDPLPDIERATADLRVAALLEPGFAEIQLQLGTALATLAEHQAKHGVDPQATAARAAAVLQRCLARQPDSVAALRSLALVRMRDAVYAGEHRREWRPAHLEALASALEATRRDPGAFGAWQDLGTVQMLASRMDRDPAAQSRLFDSALAALRRAVELAPDENAPRVNVAAVRGLLATTLANRGEDPTPHYAAGIYNLEEVVRRNPRDALAQRNLGTLHVSRAQYVSRHEKLDPGPDLEAGVSHLREALRLDPENAMVAMLIGQAEWTRGLWQATHEVDPLATLDRALVSAEAAVRMQPRQADMLWLVAMVHSVRAEWLVPRHHNADIDIAAGLSAANSAFAINPKHAPAAFARAALAVMSMRAHPDAERARAALSAIADSVAILPATSGELEEGKVEAEKILARARARE